ncbi:MAG: M48 family metallopeptidase [Burkholderiales bacterium]|jgi:STE24 endopeptidase|nr:M48 family metallopeptidase [Burkholderiales bacterium]
MNTFTAVFLAALALSTATRLWLGNRHIRYVWAHRARVPDGFASEITPAAHEKAAQYTAAKTRLSLVHVVVDALVLLALTLGGVLNWLDELWRSALGPGLWSGLALIGSAVVIMSLIDLPLSWYRTFRIESRFGFNQMTLALFVSDLVKQALVGTAIGAPFLIAVLWLMEEMGSNWWLYVWPVWVVFSVVMLVVYPTFIAPLFNKFSPMQEGDLKRRIEALLVKCGFRSQGLFVMDGSKRSSHGNAYFTGFGRAKRIVFFDTLLSRLDAPEIEAVLAHELGHFKLRHVAKRMVLTFLLSLVFLWVLGRLMNEPWFYQGLGVHTPSTAMALLLFFLVVPVFTFLLQPLMSVYSRKHEFEADAYAAKQASAADLAQALVKLYKDNASTLTPDPLHSAFYDSHPPAALRIARLQQSAPA